MALLVRVWSRGLTALQGMLGSVVFAIGSHFVVEDEKPGRQKTSSARSRLLGGPPPGLEPEPSPPPPRLLSLVPVTSDHRLRHPPAAQAGTGGHPGSFRLPVQQSGSKCRQRNPPSPSTSITATTSSCPGPAVTSPPSAPHPFLSLTDHPQPAFSMPELKPLP